MSKDKALEVTNDTKKTLEGKQENIKFKPLRPFFDFLCKDRPSPSNAKSLFDVFPRDVKRGGAPKVLPDPCLKNNNF